MTHDETTIISGALDLTMKTAKDAMTPLSGVFSLDLNTKLDKYAMPLHFPCTLKAFIVLHKLIIFSLQ